MRWLFLLVLPAFAQEANPMSSELRAMYTIIKNNLVKMAERMPEENYSFKPVPEVQNFQQRMAHIADANVRTCAASINETHAVRAAQKTAKADLVAALKESFAVCDRAFDITDKGALEMVEGAIGSPPVQGKRTRLSTLWNVVRHSNEMYGYMSVYLRVKGIVPPSTAPME